MAPLTQIFKRLFIQTLSSDMAESSGISVNKNILIIRINYAFRWGYDISRAFASLLEYSMFTDRLGRKRKTVEKKRIAIIHQCCTLPFFSQLTLRRKWRHNYPFVFLTCVCLLRKSRVSGWLGSPGREQASTLHLTRSWSSFLYSLVFVFFPLLCLKYSFTNFCNLLYSLFACFNWGR